MIPNDLLQILVCPETKQPLQEVPADVLVRFNAAVTSGTLRNRAGQVVKEPLAGALLRADGLFAYPIREGIPIMLVDESFAAKTE